MIGRRAEQVFRHHMSASPDGEQSPRGDLRALDRDVAGGVADAEDQDALAGEGLGRAVMMGVDLLTNETARTWKGWLGVPRIPMVAVCDNHGAVPFGTRRPVVPPLDGDIPVASRRRL